MRKWLIALLMLLALACNFPGYAGIGSPTAEGVTAESTSAAEATGEATPGDEVKPTPESLETPTVSGATVRPTQTPTPTPSPTPTPTPTPRPVAPGPPLVFQDPAWELVSWEKVPDTNDWQGILRLQINGGRAPYRAQLENNPIVNGLEVQARWRLCAAMPATVRVWSDDGQFAEAKIYVWEIGCTQ